MTPGVPGGGGRGVGADEGGVGVERGADADEGLEEDKDGALGDLAGGVEAGVCAAEGIVEVAPAEELVREAPHHGGHLRRGVGGGDGARAGRDRISSREGGSGTVQ